MAPSLGYTSIPKNVGSMRNSGFELSLNYRAVNTKDIKLEVFANATFGKNRIVSLDPSILNADGAWEAASTRLVIPGESFYQLWLVEYAGLDERGTAQYWAKRNVLDNAGEPIVRARSLCCAWSLRSWGCWCSRAKEPRAD